MASSAAVYGSRNPYRYPERINPDTPVHPIDQYGQDKVLAEAAVRASGLPYALFVKAGSDGEGAVRSVERILTGLKWRAALPPLLVTRDLHDDDLERAHELGITMAAGLEAGVFS